MIPIKGNEFGEEQLKLSDVWTWQSDLHASEDSLVPVPLTEDALTEADSLLIHATFVTASGTKLNGLIVYQLGDDEIFAIEVLSGRNKFTFNRNLPDLSFDELKRLAAFLDEDVESLLPIRYSVVPKELAIDDGKFFFQTGTLPK
ncbi:MAG: hypothetical protein ABL888_12065 [Pirellulaceae bacterium]